MSPPAGHVLAINDELGRVLELYSRVLSAQTNAIARGAKPNEGSLLGLQLGSQQGAVTMNYVLFIDVHVL